MPEEKKIEKAWWQPALLTFTKMSVWIAAPIILGVFLGKSLDERYGTEPWLFLITVGLGFLVSMVGIGREAMKEIKKIEKENSKNNKIEK